MADEVIGFRRRGTVVWVKARVGREEFEVGALREGAWTMNEPAGFLRNQDVPIDERNAQKAHALVVAWAEEQRDDLAPLFSEAAAERGRTKDLSTLGEGLRDLRDDLSLDPEREG